MDRKSLLREIADRLRKIREPLGYSQREMGERASAERSSYTRCESGETFPKLMTLYKLGTEFDISLDWLILNRGPMHYKEKEAIKEVNQETTAAEPPAPEKTLPDDVKELVEILPWKDMAGTRDKMIHHYFGVDLKVVWKTITEDIPFLYMKRELLRYIGADDIVHMWYYQPHIGSAYLAKNFPERLFNCYRYI